MAAGDLAQAKVNRDWHIQLESIVASQFDPEDWYRSLHDAVIVASILNRIVSAAGLLQLDGPNMRRHSHVPDQATT